MYHHHTGYIGNLKSVPLDKLLEQHPERALEHAVKGKLRVFAGPEHKHAAQQPIPLDVNA